ncbi:MAG: hypothetical protein JJW00_06645 [Sulfurimonas sp.]|nr:hypothetical protein [Sulfurimonas sp.]
MIKTLSSMALAGLAAVTITGCGGSTPEAKPETTVNAEVKKPASTNGKNDEVLWQQFQSKQAMDNLAKEFPPE